MVESTETTEECDLMQVQLYGTLPPAYRLEVPDEISIEVRGDRPSFPHTLKVRNTGSSSQTFSVWLEAGPDFTLTGSGECGQVASLDPGETCTYGLTFTRETPGSSSGSILIITEQNGDEYEIPIYGTRTE